MRWRVLYYLIFLVFVTPVFSKTWIGNCTFSNPLDLVYGEYNNTSYLLCLSNNTSSYYSIKNILGTEEAFIYETNYPAFLYFYPIGNDTIYMPSYDPSVGTANISIIKNDFTLDTKLSISFSYLMDIAGYQNCLYLGGIEPPPPMCLYKICYDGVWSVDGDIAYSVPGLSIENNYLYLINITDFFAGTAEAIQIDLINGTSQVIDSEAGNAADIYSYGGTVYLIYGNGSIYKLPEKSLVYSFGNNIALSPSQYAIDFAGYWAIVGLESGGIYVVNLQDGSVTQVDNSSDVFISLTHNDTHIFGLTSFGDIYSYPFEFAGWVCINASYSGYMHADGSITDISYCEWGCEGAVPWTYNASWGGRCIPERPPGYGQYQQGMSDGVCVGSASSDADCCTMQGGYWWNRQCWAEPVAKLVNIVGNCSSHLDCPAGSFCDNGKCVQPTPIYTTEGIKYSGDYMEFRTNATLWFSSTVPIPQRFSLKIEHIPIDIRPVLNVLWDESSNSIKGYFVYYNGNIYVCNGVEDKLYLFNTSTESLEYVASNCFIVDLDYQFSNIGLNLVFYSLADLDDDGYLDLITVNESANVCIYEENSSHSFELVSCFSTKVNIGSYRTGFSEECGNIVAFENKYIRYISGSYKIFDWTNVNTGESLSSCGYLNFRCFNNKIYTSAFIGDPGSGYAYTTCDMFPECYQEYGMNACGWYGYVFLMDDEAIFSDISVDCLRLYKENSYTSYATACPYYSFYFEYPNEVFLVDKGLFLGGYERIPYSIVTDSSAINDGVGEVGSEVVVFSNMVLNDFFYTYYNGRRVGNYHIQGNYLFKVQRPANFEEPSVTVGYKTYEKTFSLPAQKTVLYSPMIVDMVNEDLRHSLFSLSFDGEPGFYRVSVTSATPLFQGGVSLPPPPPTECGDGICGPDEDPKTCPLDCLVWFNVSSQTINAYLSKGECKIYTINLTWQSGKEPESTLIRNVNPKFAVEPKNNQIFVFTRVAPNTYVATVPIKVCIPEYQLVKVELPYYLGTDTIQFKIFSEQREYLRELKVNTYEIRKYDLTWIVVLLFVAIAVLVIWSRRKT